MHSEAFSAQAHVSPFFQLADLELLPPDVYHIRGERKVFLAEGHYSISVRVLYRTLLRPGNLCRFDIECLLNISPELPLGASRMRGLVLGVKGVHPLRNPKDNVGGPGFGYLRARGAADCGDAVRQL